MSTRSVMRDAIIKIEEDTIVRFDDGGVNEGASTSVASPPALRRSARKIRRIIEENLSEGEENELENSTDDEEGEEEEEREGEGGNYEPEEETSESVPTIGRSCLFAANSDLINTAMLLLVGESFQALGGSAFPSDVFNRLKNQVGLYRTQRFYDGFQKALNTAPFLEQLSRKRSRKLWYFKLKQQPFDQFRRVNSELTYEKCIDIVKTNFASGKIQLVIRRARETLEHLDDVFGNSPALPQSSPMGAALRENVELKERVKTLKERLDQLKAIPFQDLKYTPQTGSLEVKMLPNGVIKKLIGHTEIACIDVSTGDEKTAISGQILEFAADHDKVEWMSNTTEDRRHLKLEVGVKNDEGD